MCAYFQLEILEPLPVHFSSRQSQVGAKTFLIIFMVAIFSFQAFLLIFGDFYPRVKFVSQVMRFSHAGKAVPDENRAKHACIRDDTALSQGYRSGAINISPEMDSLTKK